MQVDDTNSNLCQVVSFVFVPSRCTCALGTCTLPGQERLHSIGQAGIFTITGGDQLRLELRRRHQLDHSPAFEHVCMGVCGGGGKLAEQLLSHKHSEISNSKP